MVAVAEQHVAQVSFVPFVENERVVELCFLFFPHIKGLALHNKSHAVAQLQQLGCRRIVCSAYAIYAHGFKYFELALDGARIYGSTQST